MPSLIQISLKKDMDIRFLILLPLALLTSCSNPGKRAEDDRRNIHLAQFFYEQGISSKSVAHAKKIKPDSPHYAAAQELIFQAGEETP